MSVSIAHPMMDHCHRQQYDYQSDNHYESPNATLWDLDSSSLVVPSYLNPLPHVYNQTAIQREASYESGCSGDDRWPVDWLADEQSAQWPSESQVQPTPYSPEVPFWFPQQDPHSAEPERTCWQFPGTFDATRVDQQVAVDQVGDVTAPGASGSTSSDESSHQVKLPSGTSRSRRSLHCAICFTVIYRKQVLGFCV